MTRSLVRLALTILTTVAVCAVPAVASAHSAKAAPGKACVVSKKGKAATKNPHCAPCPAAAASKKSAKGKKQHCSKQSAVPYPTRARGTGTPQRTRPGPSANASDKAQPGYTQTVQAEPGSCDGTATVVSAPATVQVSSEVGEGTGTRYGVIIDSCAYAQPGAISQVTVTNPRTGATTNHYDTVLILDSDTIDAGFYVSQSLESVSGDSLEVRLYDANWNETLIVVTIVE